MPVLNSVITDSLLVYMYNTVYTPAMYITKAIVCVP